jgi:hypothetical protein
MFCFFENIRTTIFCGHVVTEGVFVTQLSSDGGIPVLRNVWFKKSCLYLSGIS